MSTKTSKRKRTARAAMRYIKVQLKEVDRLIDLLDSAEMGEDSQPLDMYEGKRKVVQRVGPLTRRVVFPKHGEKKEPTCSLLEDPKLPERESPAFEAERVTGFLRTIEPGESRPIDGKYVYVYRRLKNVLKDAEYRRNPWAFNRFQLFGVFQCNAQGGKTVLTPIHNPPTIPPKKSNHQMYAGRGENLEFLSLEAHKRGKDGRNQFYEYSFLLLPYQLNKEGIESNELQQIATAWGVSPSRVSPYRRADENGKAVTLHLVDPLKEAAKRHEMLAVSLKNLEKFGKENKKSKKYNIARRLFMLLKQADQSPEKLLKFLNKKDKKLAALSGAVERDAIGLMSWLMDAGFRYRFRRKAQWPDPKPCYTDSEKIKLVWPRPRTGNKGSAGSPNPLACGVKFEVKGTAIWQYGKTSDKGPMRPSIMEALWHLTAFYVEKEDNYKQLAEVGAKMLRALDATSVGRIRLEKMCPVVKSQQVGPQLIDNKRNSWSVVETGGGYVYARYSMSMEEGAARKKGDGGTEKKQSATKKKQSATDFNVNEAVTYMRLTVELKALVRSRLLSQGRFLAALQKGQRQGQRSAPKEVTITTPKPDAERLTQGVKKNKALEDAFEHYINDPNTQAALGVKRGQLKGLLNDVLGDVDNWRLGLSYASLCYSTYTAYSKWSDGKLDVIDLLKVTEDLTQVSAAFLEVYKKPNTPGTTVKVGSMTVKSVVNKLNVAGTLASVVSSMVDIGRSKTKAQTFVHVGQISLTLVGFWLGYTSLPALPVFLGVFAVQWFIERLKFNTKPLMMFWSYSYFGDGKRWGQGSSDKSPLLPANKTFSDLMKNNTPDWSLHHHVLQRLELAPTVQWVNPLRYTGKSSKKKKVRDSEGNFTLLPAGRLAGTHIELELTNVPMSLLLHVIGGTKISVGLSGFRLMDSTGQLHSPAKWTQKPELKLIRRDKKVRVILQQKLPALKPGVEYNHVLITENHTLAKSKPVNEKSPGPVLRICIQDALFGEATVYARIEFVMDKSVPVYRHMPTSQQRRAQQQARIESYGELKVL